MDTKNIRRILLGCKEIEDVLCFEKKKYNDVMYDFLVECQLVVCEECVPIRIGINDDWPIKLFDFYIHYENDLDDSKFRFIPHVDVKGKLCLWNLDSILIEAQFEGLLQECVRKSAQIIENGKTGANKVDFIKEFSAYWRDLPNIGYARLIMPQIDENTIIKWGNDNNDMAAIKGRHLIAAVSSNVIAEWYGCKEPLRNAAFFNIDATNDALFPINPNKPEYISYIKKLLSSVNNKDKVRIIDKLRPPYIIFFHIRQPNNYFVDIGFCINAKYSSVSEILRLSSREEIIIEPILVKRIDREYLMRRVFQQKSPLEPLRYLIIGAGSIGGYFIDFLCRAGGKNVTVVDGELMFEENIFRHLLGKTFINKPKAKAICNYMEASLPEVNFKSIPMKIEEAYKKKYVKWNDYDVIIAATGNENVNRWLEKNIEASSAKCKVIYLWNEPLDIGCHAAYVNMELSGRYRDMFHYDNNNMLYNMSAFAAPNQEFAGGYTGCDGSFMPYGSEVSVQVALLGMDLLKKSACDILKENVVTSYKGDGLFFRKAGFKVSLSYELQMEKVCVRMLNKYGG